MEGLLILAIVGGVVYVLWKKGKLDKWLGGPDA